MTSPGSGPRSPAWLRLRQALYSLLLPDICRRQINQPALQEPSGTNLGGLVSAEPAALEAPSVLENRFTTKQTEPARPGLSSVGRVQRSPQDSDIFPGPGHTYSPSR